MWTAMLLWGGAVEAAELWMRIDAAHSGEAMTIEVPYTWLTDGTITPAMQAEILQFAGELPEVAAWIGAVPEGAVVPIPTDPRGYDRVEVVLLGRPEAPAARSVVVESWDADGRAASPSQLSLRAARMLLPMMAHVTINGQALLQPAEAVLDLDQALANMTGHPPTTFVEVTQASGRIRISTE